MKNAINPMQNAVRCTAHSKRTGLPCNAPAVTGWSVCRLHGAGGGAPGGVANGNFKTGYWTKEAMLQRKLFRILLRHYRVRAEML